jgi:hypothetical protein
MGALTYSGTAASNTTVDGIGAAGSDSPDNIDNLVRALAASDVNLVKDLGGFNTVAGTADAITIALADASTITNYTDKLIGFVAASDNATTSPTLNVDSVGAEPIKKAVLGVETALAAGDIQGGAYYLVRWRSTWDGGGGAWELLDPASKTFQNLILNGFLAGKVTGGTRSSFSRFSADTGGALLSLDKSRNASIDGQTIVQSNDTLGVIDFRGSDGSGFITAATIGAIVNGTPGTNDMPGGIYFSTTPDGTSSPTERLFIYQNGQWRVNGSDAVSNGQVIKQTSGATAWGSAATLMSAASASGSSVPFTSIPSWVRQIIIMFNAVSLSGTDDILVQIGDAGGLETTGYVSTSANSGGAASSTSGYIVNMTATGDVLSGHMILTSLSTNNDLWMASHSGKISTTSTVAGGGDKTLSPGPLTQLAIVPSGVNTFDGGNINVLYL